MNILNFGLEYTRFELGQTFRLARKSSIPSILNAQLKNMSNAKDVRLGLRQIKVDSRRLRYRYTGGMTRWQIVFISQGVFGALDELQPRVPPMYITKYNRYVDNVLNKINKILRNGYDPVNVRLHTVKSNKKGDNKKPNKNKGKQKNQKKNKKQRSEDSSESSKDTETTLTTETNLESTTVYAPTTILSNDKSIAKQDESRAKTPQKKQKNKNKKNNSKQSKPRAKATLYGLASLKRKNDVQVNLMSTHNTIKSKFYIGPLTLKVEKEFGRGAKKEIRSATATTTEMMGKINLRINHGGGAMLHSIRVMQPNLLRIDNPDEQDKTREFVWKRSSHIAQIVSQKLTKAARSLMRSTPKKPMKKKPQATGGLLSFFG